MEGLFRSNYFLFIMLGFVVLFPAIIRVVAIILTIRWSSSKRVQWPGWAHAECHWPGWAHPGFKQVWGSVRARYLR